MAVLLFQLDPLGSQLSGPLIFRTLGLRLFLVCQLADAALLLLEDTGQSLGIYAQLAGGFVNKVHRLVGLKAVGDVAVAEASGGNERRIVDLNLVVRLVSGPESLQNLHRFLDGRLLQENRLEAALQGGVLLDVAAVLIAGGSADALELPPGQGWLEQVAGVDTAFRRPGADHGVNLVQKQDYLPLGLLHLINHRLETFLELAPKLGAGYQGPHVQSEHPPAL